MTLSKLFQVWSRIPCFLRILLLRLRGIDISFTAKVDAHVEITKGCRIAKGVHIQRGVCLSGNVSVGEGSTIGVYSSLSTMPDGHVKIGKHVLINSFSTIGAAESVTIGDDCIFAAYLQITDAEHGFEDRTVLIREAPWTSSPVMIEEDVWIGTQVVVLKGVRLGKGSVIGAKSLVNKVIPEYSIATGLIPRCLRRCGKNTALQYPAACGGVVYLPLAFLHQ